MGVMVRNFESVSSALYVGTAQVKSTLPHPGRVTLAQFSSRAIIERCEYNSETFQVAYGARTYPVPAELGRGNMRSAATKAAVLRHVHRSCVLSAVRSYHQGTTSEAVPASVMAEYPEALRLAEQLAPHRRR